MILRLLTCPTKIDRVKMVIMSERLFLFFCLIICESELSLCTEETPGERTEDFLDFLARSWSPPPKFAVCFER